MRRRAALLGADQWALDDVAALIRDLPRLCGEATIEQRRELVAGLMEVVAVDIENHRVEGFVAVAAFDALLREAALIVASERFRLVSGDRCGGDGGE